MVGIFLAKGAKDPGGSIYLWLFEKVAGFNAFRDPTKFYLLIAIVYSVLIPTTLDEIGKKLPQKAVWKVIPHILFIVFWFFTIRQAITGQLSGTFVAHRVPQEYEVLHDIVNTPDYFRTFWLPHTQRYGDSTYMHPAIDAATILNTASSSALLAWVNSTEGNMTLAHWSVKYVILPYDSQGEIFLDDRKYNESLRTIFETTLDANTYLTKRIIPGISPKMSVYETKSHMDLFWVSEAPDATVAWHMVSPTRYTFTIQKSKELHLIFGQSYDPHWQVRGDGHLIRSAKTQDGLNSFIVPADFQQGVLEYAPQKYVEYGLWISAISFVLVLAAIIVL
jgi:hypothetical protein